MHAICVWAPLDSVQQRGCQRSLKAPCVSAKMGPGDLRLVTSLRKKPLIPWKWSHFWVPHTRLEKHMRRNFTRQVDSWPHVFQPCESEMSATWPFLESGKRTKKITDNDVLHLKKIPTMFFSYKISLQTTPWTPRFRFPGIRATFWPEDPGE